MKPITETRHSAPGYTLIEMVLSLVLLSIVMLSAGSAMMFAARATPGADSPTRTILVDTGVVARIAEDLAQAKYLTARSATGVTMVVPDRTGDGIPDTIRYAWSGQAGDPLTYTLNGEAALPLVESVQAFQIDYEIATATDTIPTALRYGSERVVASYDSSVSGGDESVDASDWFAQAISPALTGDALGFVATKLDLYAGWDDPKDGQASLTLRNRTLSIPGNTVYASGTAYESMMSGATGWKTYAFDAADPVADGENLSLVVGYASGTDNVIGTRSVSSGSGMSESRNAGATWSLGLGKSLVYRLYGIEIVDAKPPYEITRTHVSAVTIGLQSSANGRSPVQKHVSLLLGPPLLGGFWEAGFDASPTSLDLNGDGAVDWIYGAGGSLPDDALEDSAWQASASLIMIPTTVSSGVTRIEARMRASNGGTPGLYGPYHVDALGQVMPLATVLREDGLGGQELLIYNENTPTTPILTIDGLGAGWVDVRLTLLPAEDVVHLEVNGIDRGSHILSRVADQGRRGFWLSGNGAGAGFADVFVSVGGTYAPSNDDDGLLGGLLDDVLGGLLN